MKLELRSNKDFWAGMMLMGAGAGAMFIARNYRFGKALRMGPGFFPMVLGGLLIAFGICVVAVGLHSNEKTRGAVSLRAAVMLPVSLVLFGILMKGAGFIPAVGVLVFASAAAGKEFKTLEVLLLAAVLTLASTALFIWGLQLPYPLIKGL